MLKSNEDIQGIKIGGEEYKLSQFADDTTILLDGQEKSLVETMKTLRLFASLSGLKINRSKTKAVWIGSKKFSGETFNHRFKFEWNQKEFIILGIRFSCNLNNMIELNYREIILNRKRTKTVVKTNFNTTGQNNNFENSNHILTKSPVYISSKSIG